MMGFRAPFVPGWDCHGMPIEFKVSRELGGDKARTISKLELRKLCRAESGEVDRFAGFGFPAAGRYR